MALGTGARGFPAAAAPDARGAFVNALVRRRPDVPGRPERRPAHLAAGGVTLLRTTGAGSEIWCRCDGGPHGFLGIAAHAHADALAVEVRVGGVDVLADPGTYCYHGDARWRAYFRSTVAHNTVELDGHDQSTSGGPFLWLRHTNGRLVETDVDEDADVVSWCAEHQGYAARHTRRVSLDRWTRTLRVEDTFTGGSGHRVRMAYHLGPDVTVDLDGVEARLEWPGGGGRLALPASLRWTAHRGETDPPLGWYSPGFGTKTPATTLVGVASAVPAAPMVTVLHVE